MIRVRALEHCVIGARMVPPGGEFDAPSSVARHLLRHGAAEVVFPEDVAVTAPPAAPEAPPAPAVEAAPEPPAPEPAPEPPPPSERRHAPTHGRRRR